MTTDTRNQALRDALHDAHNAPREGVGRSCCNTYARAADRALKAREDLAMQEPASEPAPASAPSEEVIEAMARAMLPLGEKHFPWENHVEGTKEKYRRFAQAAYATIPASTPSYCGAALEKATAALKLIASQNERPSNSPDPAHEHYLRTVLIALAKKGLEDSARAQPCRCGELREALEPFAKAAEIKLCGEWRDDQRFGQTDVSFYLTFGDLRRAARALSVLRARAQPCRCGELREALETRRAEFAELRAKKDKSVGRRMLEAYAHGRANGLSEAVRIIEAGKPLELHGSALSVPSPEGDRQVKQRRAGHDFPCALHKGPAGDCNESNCKC